MIHKMLIVFIFTFLTSMAFGKNFIENEGFTKTETHRKEDTTKMTNLKDGPYIIWKKNNKIISYYYFTDRKGKNITERKKFYAASDTFLYSGFNFDTLTYKLHKYNKIEKSGWYNIEKIMVIGDVHGDRKSVV